MFCSIKVRKLVVIIVSILTFAVILGKSCFTSTVKAEIKKMNSDEIPIIMYHSILKDEDMWNDYVLSPVEFEKDIIWLKENGYKTVFINDIINYVNGSEKLPENPVVITLDDGFYNNYYYVFPLLKKYNIKATISLVGSYSEFACEEAQPQPAYSYLDWENINEMRKSGLVEFANHSYNLHSLENRKGASINKGESYENYRHVLLTDVFKNQHLIEDFCGFTPNIFTYPYGFTCEPGERLIKNSGFAATLGTEEKMNYVEIGDKNCLYNMHRFNRPSFITTEKFMKKCGIE